jgi:hypothetical protein
VGFLHLVERTCRGQRQSPIKPQRRARQSTREAFLWKWKATCRCFVVFLLGNNHNQPFLCDCHAMHVKCCQFRSKPLRQPRTSTCRWFAPFEFLMFSVEVTNLVSRTSLWDATHYNNRTAAGGILFLNNTAGVQGHRSPTSLRSCYRFALRHQYISEVCTFLTVEDTVRTPATSWYLH